MKRQEETDWTPQAVQEHKFGDSISFKHQTSLNELRKQQLRVILLTKPEGSENNPNVEPVQLAQYQVRMFIVAIGPVHHGIELMKSTKNMIGMTSKAFVGRFDMDLQFTQTQKVEIQLTHLKAKLNNE